MKRIETILARLFLVCASLVVAFILLEAGANHFLWNIATDEQFNKFASYNQLKAKYGDDYYSRSAGDQVVLFTPHVHLGYMTQPDYRAGENRHNALGFRGEEISLDKPEGVYRIATLGGSTTYNVAVKDYRQSYPHQLQGYLRDNGFAEVEVFNAGVGGYTSHQNLMNLQFRVLPLQPDLVIIYQGYNDVHTRLVYPFAAYRADNSGYMAPRVSATVMPAIQEYSTLLRALAIQLGLMQSHSDFEWHVRLPASTMYQNRFTTQWRLGQYPSGIFSQVPALDMLENNPPIHFERNLRHILAVAERHDVDVLLLTFVTSSGFDNHISSDAYQFALAQHNDITRAAAESSQARLLDLRAVFPDDPGLFSDGYHMRADGNALRARLIGDFIIREFLS